MGEIKAMGALQLPRVLPISVANFFSLYNRPEIKGERKKERGKKGHGGIGRVGRGKEGETLT